MQIIEVNYNNIIYNSSKKYLNNFNDESIFFTATNNDNKFYEIKYIVQYKIIELN